MKGIYRNSTEVAELHGVPIYMSDLADACLYGRLNLFLQGDTGSGKTQLARDAMAYFPNKSMFVLGRNDMDTRELFQQINPKFFSAIKNGKSIEGINSKQITDAINYNLIVVDELPNCVPAVRAQLFNLFDGFIEIDGNAYPIGNGYSVGIATGNIGRSFTESSNDLGRALKDRMHVIVDTDYFSPTPSDTLEILAENTNPRVEFTSDVNGDGNEIIGKYQTLERIKTPFEKNIIANYLVHGLDYCVVEGEVKSKRKLKEAWPNSLDGHSQGSDEALVLPLSMRAAKSTIKLSNALDEIAREKGAEQEDINSGAFSSMMTAYRLVAPYSGVLNEAAVRSNHSNDHYVAIDSVIQATAGEFQQQKDNLTVALFEADKGTIGESTLNQFWGRWHFMKNILKHIAKSQEKDK
ncbi:hypothetical protein COU53_00860 [Candidatus Pacearchaeota archaeon CG10_big_fil_rev_8_21_14_0_10_30_48]|nr:MAG: hypothetical protein COU53_00860 [Candidatus Pacearchaeota archaeon CG10_big_fil_rev_8_21_14_0_10_30_48]